MLEDHHGGERPMTGNRLPRKTGGYRGMEGMNNPFPRLL